MLLLVFEILMFAGGVIEKKVVVVFWLLIGQLNYLVFFLLFSPSFFSHYQVDVDALDMETTRLFLCQQWCNL